jgi:hypothetical protein
MPCEVLRVAEVSNIVGPLEEIKSDGPVPSPMAVAAPDPPTAALKVVVPVMVRERSWFPVTGAIEAKARVPPTVIVTSFPTPPDRLVPAFTSTLPFTAIATPLASESVSPFPLPKVTDPGLVKTSESRTTELSKRVAVPAPRISTFSLKVRRPLPV